MWIEGWPDICLLLALITSSMLPRTTAATLYQPGETVCLLTPDIRELLKDLSESAPLAGQGVDQRRSKRAATRDMLGSQTKSAPQTYFGIQFDANGTASPAECTVGSTAVVVLELRSKRWNPSMGDVTSLHFVDLETKMKNSMNTVWMESYGDNEYIGTYLVRLEDFAGVTSAILDIQFVKERSVDDLDRAFRSKTQNGRKLGAYDLGEIIGWAVLPRGKGSATLQPDELISYIQLRPEIEVKEAKEEKELNWNYFLHVTLPTASAIFVVLVFILLCTRPTCSWFSTTRKPNKKKYNGVPKK